jgi:hypothetical protein
VEQTVKKRYIKSAVAIAVLLVLWFAFNGWNKHESHEKATEQQTKSAPKVLALDASRIQSFTIATPDGASFTCAKQGKTWAITKPLAIRADQGKIASFLQSLTSATEDQQITAHPGNLKDFGLDPAAETLSLTADTEPRQFKLLLGSETPTSSGVYAQVAGHPQVFTLTDDVKTALEKKLFDLRDTRAVTLDTDQINRIQVTNGRQNYALVKNQDGTWDVTVPISVRADHFTVEGLVDSLQSLAMQSVVSEGKTDAAKYGLAKPAVSVALITPGGSQTLAIGHKASQGYYAMNSALAPIFTLDENSVSQFQKNAGDFRDKNLFSWDMFDVKSFDVTTPKGHWAFEQDKDKWRETAPALKPASSDDVNAFLSALRNLQASSFPAAKPGEINKFGFDNPSYTFKVTFGAKNQTETVDVAEANGHVYARRAADPLPSEVEASNLKAVDNAFEKISK